MATRVPDLCKVCYQLPNERTNVALHLDGTGRDTHVFHLNCLAVCHIFKSRPKYVCPSCSVDLTKKEVVYLTKNFFKSTSNRKDSNPLYDSTVRGSAEYPPFNVKACFASSLKEGDVELVFSTSAQDDDTTDTTITVGNVSCVGGLNRLLGLKIDQVTVLDRVAWRILNAREEELAKDLIKIALQTLSNVTQRKQMLQRSSDLLPIKEEVTCSLNAIIAHFDEALKEVLDECHFGLILTPTDEFFDMILDKLKSKTGLELNFLEFFYEFNALVFFMIKHIRKELSYHTQERSGYDADESDVE